MTHAETEITAGLVRDLLRDQHPDLADRPLSLGARGWDNQLWRLGGDLAVRLPWATQTADALLLKEHAWLPALAPRLPLPVPVPQRLGEPSGRFPRPWIVTTWVPGDPADRAPVTRGEEAADALAAFLTALHQPAPAAAPGGRGRGGTLAGRAEGFARALAETVDLGLVPDPGAVRAIWDDAVTAPAWGGPPGARQPTLPCGASPPPSSGKTKHHQSKTQWWVGQGYEPYDARLCRLGQSPVVALTSADLRLEVFLRLLRLPRLRVPLHPVHRPVHKSGSRSRMGVGEGERPNMIAVQEGGGIRAS